MSAGIIIPLCPATTEGKAKVKKTGMFLSEYSGSFPNGHSCERTALLTTDKAPFFPTPIQTLYLNNPVSGRTQLRTPFSRAEGVRSQELTL